MIFNDTKSILKYIKSIMVMNEIQNKDLADLLQISESALSARFKQDNISINLLLEITNSLGLAMDITFIDKKNISKLSLEQQRRSYEYQMKIVDLQNESDTD